MDNLNRKSNGFISIKKLIISVVVLVTAGISIIAVNSLNKDKDINNTKISDQTEISSDNNSSNNDSQIEIKKDEKIVDMDLLQGIVCWGDSLTAGAGGEGITYPNVLSGMIEKEIRKIEVVNRGVGGEDTNTIIGRAGAVPFKVKSFTIPKYATPVDISLSSENGHNVAPLKQGNGGLNPVTIAGVEGTIVYDKENNKYKFVRTKVGDETLVKDNETVITSSTNKFNDYANVIFIGQNGGWDSIDELISQQKSIISKMNKNNDRYLVLGLTTGSKEERAELEKAMEKEYGDKYVNLREYLSSNGFEKSGITPTEDDSEAMKKGIVPRSLLIDGVHFNSMGYQLIGKYVYERMTKLAYFE